MKVKVHLYSQSNPCVMNKVENTYTKDGLYCVNLDDGCLVFKFPVEHIFRITEIANGE